MVLNSIPAQGTKILQAIRHGQQTKQTKHSEVYGQERQRVRGVGWCLLIILLSPCLVITRTEMSSRKQMKEGTVQKKERARKGFEASEGGGAGMGPSLVRDRQQCITTRFRNKHLIMTI